MTQTELELDLGTDTITCSAEEVSAVLAGMLGEMRAAAPFIPAEERAALRHIMEHESGTLTVADVFPDFTRDSAAHTALRRLRTAQFIRPAGRDMWDRGEHIAVRPFARLAWDRLGEAAIFGDAPVPTAAPADDEVDLSRPDVDDPDSKETVRLKNRRAAWEDDDVLDFLKGDTPG